jgi:hypothetical protein
MARGYLSVGVRGCACWPREEKTITFGGHGLTLRPASERKEQSVHIRLKGITHHEGNALINRFLSVLAWCERTPLENIGGWSGNPVPVSVPLHPRMTGSSIEFPFCRDVPSNPRNRLVLALYREAITVNSVPYAFLGYFKIANVFWMDKYTKAGGVRTNPLIEGIRLTLPLLKATDVQDRLVEIRRTEPDVPRYLYESGRCAVAHAFATPIVDPDDAVEVHRLAKDMWVMRSLAEYLIADKLGVSRLISDAP